MELENKLEVKIGNEFKWTDYDQWKYLREWYKQLEYECCPWLARLKYEGFMEDNKVEEVPGITNEPMIIEVPEDIFENGSVLKFIDETMDNQSDDNNFEKILVEAESTPDIMPSIPTFDDVFKISIENISIHYNFPSFWRYFLLDGPSRKIEGDILIRLRTESDDNYNCIWNKFAVDLTKQFKWRNWKKLRLEINKFAWKYYEDIQKNYRKELRDWYNKRKELRKEKRNE